MSLTTTNTTEPIVKKDPIAQGSHILRSYLKSAGISFAAGSTPPLTLVNKKNGGVLNVYVGEGLIPGKNYVEVIIDPKEISSYDFNKAMAAFWSVTEAAGYGKPVVVDRGPRPQRGTVNYHDNYESVYLRHTIFSRSPDLSEEELAPYLNVIKSAARRAFFRWNNVFTSMGYDVDDLVNVGRVYTTSFLHNYAYSQNEIDNIKLLTTYLNQRYGEWAKISHKKALNGTCLTSYQVVADVTKASWNGTGWDNEETSYIDTYAEADTDPADQEYESGEYILHIQKENGTTTEARMDVRPARMLGVDIYIDGSLLPRGQAEALRSAINAGRIQVSPVPTETPVVDPEEGSLDRRLKARHELHTKLNAMTRDERELALSYAALSRDYDPDARRAARNLADELACPKCDRKVPSGSMCMSCGVEARPRYGIDYMAYREKLRAEGHSMAEAMTASIPDSELRSRQQRAQVSNNTSLADAKPEDSVIEVVAPKGKTKEEIKALSKKLSEDFMATLPPMLNCPSCGKDLPKSEFGIRVARDKNTGLPSRAARQSYCKNCRKT